MPKDTALTTHRSDWLKQHLKEQHQQLGKSGKAARYEVMSRSIFSFFRGSNSIFWADLAQDPRLETYGSPRTRIWLQADLHIHNFGSFHDRRGSIIYDLNDFDEALIADYQFDLWRLAISLLLLIKENNQKIIEVSEKISETDEKEIIEALGHSYLRTLQFYQQQAPEIIQAYTHVQAFGRLEKFLEKVAEKKSREKMLEKWTKNEQGQRILKEEKDYPSQAKLARLDQSTEKTITEALTSYISHFPFPPTQAKPKVKSLRKRLLAGTGSLGVHRYYALIEGSSLNPQDDIILDIKQQLEPSGLSFLPSEQQEHNQKHYKNNAERVVIATRTLGVDGDAMLGWITLPEGSFLVRERSPFKDDLNTKKLNSAKHLTKIAEQWGTILGAAHTRSGRNSQSFASGASFINEVNTLTKNKEADFLQQLYQIAFQYKKKIETDFQSFCELFS